MYLQGRAREISLRCNDTKQVRNVSASQCVVAHLSPAVIPLSVRARRSPPCSPTPRSAVICADETHEYQMLPFSGLTCEAPFFFFSYCSLNFHHICVLRAEIPSFRCTRNRENIVLLIPCLGGRRVTVLTRHSDGAVTRRVLSNLRVCGSQ